MQPLLSQFHSFYEDLRLSSLSKLDTLYSQDIRFIDPVAEHAGMDALHGYFVALLENCIACEFSIHTSLVQEQKGFVTWTMAYRHPKVKRGAWLYLDGCSEVIFNAENKICFQRDYYDLGAMLYQHLPIIGPVIRWLKGRLKL